jgi:predicted component of type VI protein secretion system
MVIWPSVLMLLILSSCSTLSTCSSTIVSYSSAVMDYFSSPLKTFQINTTSQTNDGTPVYLLIKSADFSHFLLEDYQTIVALMVHPNEDPDFLASFCLIPGTSKTVELEPPIDKGIAFYALYTSPGSNWKYLINTEEDFKKIEVQLGQNEIESVRLE